MLKVMCDSCREEAPEVLSEKLERLFAKLGTTDKWRVREISNDIRDEYKGEGAAPQEEKRAVFQFGHELIALALYQQVYCEKCVQKAQRADIDLVKGGKDPEKE